MLTELTNRLRASFGVEHKQDIQAIAQKLKSLNLSSEQPTLLGDDCAVIPDGESYLLFATEGMWPMLVEQDPWFAGWCSVLVNVSDIYAMGGRPIAIVDALWSSSKEKAVLIWDGMIAASQALNVPIVGGHTNCQSEYEALSVSILGRSQHLISSFKAQPGDALLLLTDFNGTPHSRFSHYWDAATAADPHSLQRKLAFLPQIAAVEFCNAGKDISTGGMIGTALMLIEASNCGAVLHLDQVPCPERIGFEQWLLIVPSYGFLLSVKPSHTRKIQMLAQALDLICQPIGEIVEGSQLTLQYGAEAVIFWDMQADQVTGFSREAL